MSEATIIGQQLYQCYLTLRKIESDFTIAHDKVSAAKVVIQSYVSTAAQVSVAENTEFYESIEEDNASTRYAETAKQYNVLLAAYNQATNTSHKYIDCDVYEYRNNF